MALSPESVTGSIPTIVYAMADSLDIGEGVSIPDEEIVTRTSRPSGPGGQHANVTASRVEVSFDIACSPSLPEWARKRLLADRFFRVTGGRG